MLTLLYAPLNAKNMNPEEANLPENKNNAFASSVLLGLGVGLLPIVTQGLSYVMSYLSAAISINQGQLISSVSSMLAEVWSLLRFKMDLILWLNLSRHHHWNFCF